MPPGSRLIAGGTDIFPWAREGRAGDVHLPALVDLSRVAELRGWTRVGSRVRLGAATVFQCRASSIRPRPCSPAPR
jgi:carbon-monoxide dehydrogenase medium subunit/xanthine dehydrogenase FAD-binding subunit